MPEPYHSFSAFLKKKFKQKKIIKIPINAGLGCPNKDGTKSETGCIFCDQYGSGPIKTFFLPIREQIEVFIKRHPGKKYIAYYQAHSNTYGPIQELKKKYEIVFEYPDIVGLFLGTRPDSIPQAIYPILNQLNQRLYLSMEMGLQSIHNKSLDFLNRNHTYEEFQDTFYQLKKRNIDVIIHLIIGIPGETRSEMEETIKEMNRLKPAGIKFHLMHILKQTPLYNHYLCQPFPLLKKEEYVDLIINLLENLHPDIVIHRLTGERDTEIFYAPEWALDKNGVINSIRSKMIRYNHYQGKHFS